MLTLKSLFLQTYGRTHSQHAQMIQFQFHQSCSPRTKIDKNSSVVAIDHFSRLPSRITSSLLWRLECVAWRIVVSHCGGGALWKSTGVVAPTAPSPHRHHGVLAPVVEWSRRPNSPIAPSMHGAYLLVYKTDSWWSIRKSWHIICII